MKIYKYIGLSFLTLALAGCQNEEVVGGQQQEEGVFTLKANMQGYSHDSRAQIQLENQSQDGEFFHWNEGDKFTLIEKIVNDNQPEVTITPKIHEFTISDSYSNNSLSSSADFTSPMALTYLSDFVAYYPALREEDSGYTFYINNTLQDNSDESWISYFKNNMFMKATGVSVPSDQMGLDFQQMCSLIRITYTNNTDTERTIYKISVDGSWGSGFHLDGEFEPSGCSSYGGDYGIEFTDGAVIPAGESKDFYILYYPIRDYNEAEDLELEEMKTVFVKLSKEDDSRLSTIAYPFGENRPNFYQGKGKRFWFNVTEVQNEEGHSELKWTKSLNEEPGGDEPGEGGDEGEDDVTYPEVPDGSFLITDKGFSEALYSMLGSDNVTLENGYAIITKEYAKTYSGDFDFEQVETLNTINSLAGIEHFTKLRSIYASNLGLTTCDLSRNTNLRSVGLTNYGMSEKKMTSIILGNNTVLRHLDVSGNDITSLDLSGLPNLNSLYCSENPNLNSLYCSENPNLNSITLSSRNLEILNVSFTELTSITIPNPAALKDLGVSGIDNISINWNEFKSLEHLSCVGKTADFVNSIPDRIKENLKSFNCGDCGLTTLNLFPFKYLEELECANNMITRLDVSHLTEMKRLTCDDNRMIYLDLSNLNNLESLTCGHQKNDNDVYIVLDLLLSAAMQERWNNTWTDQNGFERNAWKNEWSHKVTNVDGTETIYVKLVTTPTSTGNGTSGSDFTYGDNNIW